MHHEADSASCPPSARPDHQRPPALDHPITPAAHVPFSCWKQEALLSGSSGCRRTPLLGGGLSYSLSGSMACSLSTAGSECRGRDCGNPNIKREEKKSKAPQSRKPAHQAPIQRGSSGVMSRLPATRRSAVSGRGVAGPALGRGFDQLHRGVWEGFGVGGLDAGRSSLSFPIAVPVLPKPKADHVPPTFQILIYPALSQAKQNSEKPHTFWI